LAALVWVGWAALQLSSGPPTRAGEAPGLDEQIHKGADGLSAADDKALRALVSEHWIATPWWVPKSAHPDNI
jgi:hypothetical protein